MVAVTTSTVTTLRDGLTEQVSKDGVVLASETFPQDYSEAAENVKVNPADSTTPDVQPPSVRRLESQLPSIEGSTRDAVLYPANGAIDTQALPDVICVP